MATGDEEGPPAAPRPRHEISLSRRAARILAVVAVAAVTVVASLATRATLMFVAGTAAALLLSFPLRLLTRWMPRRTGVALLVVVVVLAIGLASYLLVPMLLTQGAHLARDLPLLAATASNRLDALEGELAGRGLPPEVVQPVLVSLQDTAIAGVGTVASALVASAFGWVQALAGVFVGFLGALFVAVYLLLEAPRLRAHVLSAAPRNFQEDAAELWDRAGDRLSRYFASLVVVALTQAFAASIFLSLLGVPYALVLGVWIGLTSTIPFIGTWFGGIPAIAIASLQSPIRGLATFGLFFLVTTVIGNAVTPRIQGAAVRVHPVIVLLGVIAAGEIFGFLGLFLAVPALAIGRILLDFVRGRVQVNLSG